MAVGHVLAYFVPDVARGLELTQNPGRVIGFHPPSITPGADNRPKASCTVYRPAGGEVL